MMLKMKAQPMQLGSNRAGTAACPRPVARVLNVRVAAASRDAPFSVDPTTFQKPSTKDEKGSNIVPFTYSGAPQSAKERIGSYLKNHAINRLRGLEKPIDKYLYLRDLQLFNPALYFTLLMEMTGEVMPFVYTPTVGEACERYHTLPIPTQGVYLSLKDKGRVLQKLQKACTRDVRVIVVTDGERILGLGDLGSNGMGISEGKIQLYTAIGGVNPENCLPVCIDIGTNNEELLAHPEYKGLKEKRIVGKEYDEFMREFMEALTAWKPHIMLQFEDFGNTNAFRLLDTYRNSHCCFNDDIQGTACVVVASILAALRASGGKIQDQRILFHGAGEAGTGIGTLFAQAVVKETGMDFEKARGLCYFIDSKGLVCKSRTDLQHHKLPFAHDVEPQPDLLSAVHAIKPTILCGVSTMANSFTEEIVRTMAKLNKSPIIMPLSNPTSKAECTYEQAYKWTDGKVVFASGSPFDPIDDNGVVHYPAQANNAYVFPAVGHAAVLTQSRTIPDGVFLVAAKALSEMSPIKHPSGEDIKHGFLLPPFHEIANVSRSIIAKVSEYIVEEGQSSCNSYDCSQSWDTYAKIHMWHVGGDPTLEREEELSSSPKQITSFEV